MATTCLPLDGMSEIDATKLKLVTIIENFYRFLYWSCSACYE